MTKAWETKFESYFHDSLVLYYEDLVKNYTQNMQKYQPTQESVCRQRMGSIF